MGHKAGTGIEGHINIAGTNKAKPKKAEAETKANETRKEKPASGLMVHRMTNRRETFVITLRPKKHVAEPYRMLKFALKYLGRRCGLKCVSITLKPEKRR